eukprot:Tamp_31970.p2 GENE.Tamp_31970~~Tamp_31970.p2  ORF type:complete len:101 (+),score=0.82 Tamp_31970:250-552(+)
MLYPAAGPLMSIVVAVAEKSGGKVPRQTPVHLASLKFQMLGNMPQTRVLTWKLMCEKALFSDFHTHQFACQCELPRLGYCSSKIALLLPRVNLKSLARKK